MHFNAHSEFAGRHAFLSASKYHWIRYDEDKLDRVFITALAAARGDRLHKLAHDMIREGIKAQGTKETFNMYVNDAINFRMTPEQILYYSDNAFGTCDSIVFRRNKLRIHDLKTGEHPCSMDQNYVYAAFFCLEYKMDPFQINTELRIYQNNEILVEEAEPDVILHIMDRIVTFDRRINELKEEALG